MARVNDPVSAGVILRSLPRAFDDLPLWAQLNITYRCNLDCAYCTEYDNSKDRVPFADLVARIDKIKELGALHAGATVTITRGVPDRVLDTEL